MIRYGHQRANDMGVDVNFAQRLAEDNGYPDDYFDLILTNLVHHEVTADASREIFKEVYRTLRPGGIYYPTDTIHTSRAAPRDAWGRYRQYLNWRWNHEDWNMEWMFMDPEGAMRDVGLIVNTDGPVRAGRRRQGSRGNYVATKA